MSEPEPRILSTPLSEAERRTLAESNFGDMFKFVVDVVRGVVAVGGEFHADGEALLLDAGSRQADVWGANDYPDRVVGDRIEYAAMINVYPVRGNRRQEIESPGTRASVQALVIQWIGPA